MKQIDRMGETGRMGWMARQEASLSLQNHPVYPSNPVYPVLVSSPHPPVPPSPRLLFPDHRIDALLEDAERRWGRGALVRWGDVVDAGDVETVPTGFDDLDDALGIGGLPCGRISELFGGGSSGKYALAASIVAQCQRQDGVAVWIDPEGRLDPEQMSVQGVDTGSLLVATPRNEMQALEMAVRLARSGGVRMMVFDLANSEQRTEGSYQSSAISYQQRGLRTQHSGPSPAGAGSYSSLITHHSSLNLALRRLVAAVHRNRIAFLFVSEQRTANSERRANSEGRANSEQRTANRSEQARSSATSLSPWERVGVRAVPQHPAPNTQNLPGTQDSGPRTTGDEQARTPALPALRLGGSLALQAISPQPSVLTPRPSTGGQALRYFASVRLEVERREWIRQGREVVGCRSAVRVVKNKLAPPYREAEVDLLFYRFPLQAIARRR